MKPLILPTLFAILILAILGHYARQRDKRIEDIVTSCMKQKNDFNACVEKRTGYKRLSNRAIHEAMKE